MEKKDRGRPAVPEDEKRRSVTVMLAPETIVRLAEIADAWDVSRGVAIDQLVAKARR
jgi:predicted transcriptional regulator